MTHKHTKTNPKPQQDAGKRNLSFNTFMLRIYIIVLIPLLLVQCRATTKPIATNDTSSYYTDLSKINSDLPSRKPLAFFVPDNSAASQAVTMPSSAASHAPENATRGQTIISMANHLPTDYDGLTLQNKTAERRICGAVTVKTESKTRHPIPLTYSVAFTQKLTGGYHA